jgi:Cu(I)/Ag(I) efflux system membrane fusion protein
MSFPIRRASRALVLLFAVALVLPLAGCGGSEPAAAEVWFCPMHPEVVSDRPGSCPICHMDLVKREDAAPVPESAAAPAAALYVCPMHPEVTSPTPGSCPICHMDLVRAEEAPSAGGAVPVRGVATAVAHAERAPRTVRTSGRVVADERRLARVESRYGGWIVGLDADFTGARVRRGQRLATLDSPELYAAQREYVAAKVAARRLLGSALPEVRRSADDLVFAARRRLELLSAPPDLIAALDAGGEPQRTVPIVAPAGGFVATKEVVRGQRVEPGMALFTLQDLSRIWIEADLYEADAAHARVGQAARVASPFDPARRIEATASFVYPELDPVARTLRVRFDAANPDEALKPGMFVDVEADLGELAGVAVPDAAVVATGERTLVFVVVDGNAEPREVHLAGRQAGRAFVAHGLADGETVVAEPAFLLDSESRLREASRRAPAATEPPAGGHEGHAP